MVKPTATVEYVVRHKNPDVPETHGGKDWVTDGAGLGWTEAEAEAHAHRCEFAQRGVPFEIKSNAPASAPPAATARGPVRASQDPVGPSEPS